MSGQLQDDRKTSRGIRPSAPVKWKAQSTTMVRGRTSRFRCGGMNVHGVRGGRPVFVATTGGHLVQLTHLAPLLEPERHMNGVWITHPSAQSESILAGADVRFVPFIHARRVDRAILGTPRILRILHQVRADTVYSTGAALAMATLPAARLVGAKSVFIESLARPDAPSLTGRILAWLPWIECYTQYERNAGQRWRYRFDLLRRFVSEPIEHPREIRRVLVTLGTAQPWGFRRLLAHLLAILPPEVEVIWQTGATDVRDLPLNAVEMMSDAELQTQIRLADVVVAHAGVGVTLRCLEAGKAPVLVPRRAEHGEHVDDHQLQIARVTEDHGLAIHVDANDLELQHLREAASRRVRRLEDPASFEGRSPQ